MNVQFVSNSIRAIVKYLNYAISYIFFANSCRILGATRLCCFVLDSNVYRSVVRGSC